MTYLTLHCRVAAVWLLSELSCGLAASETGSRRITPDEQRALLQKITDLREEVDLDPDNEQIKGQLQAMELSYQVNVGRPAPKVSASEDGTDSLSKEEKARKTLEKAVANEQDPARKALLEDALKEGSSTKFKTSVKVGDQEVSEEELAKAQPSSEVEEHVKTCLEAAAMTIGLKKKSVLKDMFKFVNKSMLAPEVNQSPYWMLAGSCINNIEEHDYEAYKSGSIAELPEKYSDMAKTKENRDNFWIYGDEMYETMRIQARDVLWRITNKKLEQRKSTKAKRVTKPVEEPREGKGSKSKDTSVEEL